MTGGVQHLRPETAAIDRPATTGIGRIVETIGESKFEIELAALVEQTSGADQLYLFYLDRDQPHVRSALSADGTDSAAAVAKAYSAGQWWRFDTTMREACTQATASPRLYQTDLAGSSSDYLRSTLFGRMHLRDRIMVCGRAADDVIGISMLRSDARGPFNSDQRSQIEWLAQLAFPLVAKHWSTMNRDRQLSHALTCLPDMNRCIAFAKEGLPPREAAVCARYLYGQSTGDIAVALNIGRETVVTYRKRLYDRLGISSHRELLLWYLDLYGSARSQGRL